MFNEAKLRAISSSPVIDFLVDRFNTKKYRGHHILQHSRTSPGQHHEICKLIKLSPSGTVEIPKGDEFAPKKPTGFKLGAFPVYEKLLTDYAKLPYDDNSSPMAMKKITFVDMERLGLIRRYKNKSHFKDYCLAGRKCSPTHVELTSKGEELAAETVTLKQEIIIAEAFKKVYSDLIDNIIMALSDPRISILSEDHFMLFMSWVHYEGNSFDIHTCIDLIVEFEALSKGIKLSIINFFKNNSNGPLSKKNKDYWDFGNWKNATQSIFKLLGKTYIFKYHDGSLIPIHSKTGAKITWKRQKNIIDEYNKVNNIQKEQTPTKIGFEYHHVIPFSWIESSETFGWIDNHKNLLYISGTSHNKIPKRNNTLVKLKSDGKNVILYNEVGEELELLIGRDILINEEFLQEVIKHNEEILSTI